MVPGGQAVHTLDLTYWFTAHRVPSHKVSVELASSPAAFVVKVRTVVAVPATLTATTPHLTHMLEETYSLSVHNVAAHTVSPAFKLSPAALVVPAGQGVHTLELTYSLTAQKDASQTVSVPLATSPAESGDSVFDDTPAHEVQTLDLTYSLALQIVESHTLMVPNGPASTASATVDVVGARRVPAKATTGAAVHP